MTRYLAWAVQCLAFTALTLTYLAAAANPAPSPRPEPVTVHPATEAENRQWEREQLEHAIDEARRADQ